MVSVVGFAIGVGLVCLAASVLLSGMRISTALRRWGCLSLLTAFFLSVVASFLSSTTVGINPRGSGGGDTLSAIGGLAVASSIAYLIVRLRRRFTRKSSDPWAQLLGRRSKSKRVLSGPGAPRSSGARFPWEDEP